MNDQQPLVGVIMGSKSDREVMQDCTDQLKELGIPHEVRVLSAHRTPKQTQEYAESAGERGIEVLIAGAGWAAHLAGVIAAHTIVPVIGVPIDSSPLNGLDALLSTSMMPAGVPVATMGIGKAGASNAAILAAQILALNDPPLAERLHDYKKQLAEGVERKDRKLKRERNA